MDHRQPTVDVGVIQGRDDPDRARQCRLLPVAALLGAVFLVWVDLAARVVNDPNEVPIGVLTALLGAPFFLALLRRAGKQAE